MVYGKQLFPPKIALLIFSYLSHGECYISLIASHTALDLRTETPKHRAMKHTPHCRLNTHIHALITQTNSGTAR